VGRQSFNTGYKLAAVLGKALKGLNVLIVASTDLSHFHPYEEAVKLDNDLVDALENYDPFLLGLNIFNKRWEACGGTPVMAALLTAQKLGCNNVRIMKYANSGDTAGDKTSVVGYVSALISESVKSENDYNENERKFLLEYARDAVEYSVNNKEVPRRPSIPEKLKKKRGVFVTLKMDGKMRGCIGEIFAQNPVIEAVRNCAVNSALKDERFKPVSEKELPELGYEISVLSPLQPLEDVSDLIIGKHGLLIVYGQLSGIILPQVAAEYGWNKTQFLEAVCRKAGLQIGAWKAPNALVFLYSAEVFGNNN
jgi:AmmeMemoRadiSam system protein A